MDAVSGVDRSSVKSPTTVNYWGVQPTG